MHTPPLIPRQHLNLVESSQVPDSVAPNLSRPPVGSSIHAILRSIDLPAPKRGPRLTTSKKLPNNQILRPLQNLQPQNLRIHPHPPFLTRMPVLGDPMIHAPTRLKVSGEPTTSTSRDPAITQQCTREHGKMATRANHPALRHSRPTQRRRIHDQQRRDQIASRTHLILAKPIGRHPQRFGIPRLDNQVAGKTADLNGLARQVIERRRTYPTKLCQRPRLGIVNRIRHIGDRKHGIRHRPRHRL